MSSFRDIIRVAGNFVYRNLRQAFRNTQQQSTRTAKENADAARDAAQQQQQRTWRRSMDINEARSILNIKKENMNDLKEINERFETLFKRNDIARGGSFYLQSKVYNAKQALEENVLSHGIQVDKDDDDNHNDDVAGKRKSKQKV